MNDIRVIPKAKSASGKDVIQRLEEVLEMAKAGNIGNVIIISTLSDGNVMDGWANTSNPFVMIGALESTKREFMDMCIERNGQ